MPEEWACSDHAPKRIWRHLNTRQFQTLVRARIPRVECPEHGVVRVKVPCTEPHGRFTPLMERFVIDVLQAPGQLQDRHRLRLRWATPSPTKNPDGPRNEAALPIEGPRSLGGGEDHPFAGLNQFAKHCVAWFKLPRFDSSIVWLREDAIGIATQLFREDGPPNVNAFVLKGDVYLCNVRHGRSPLKGPYLNPGPPT